MGADFWLPVGTPSNKDWIFAGNNPNDVKLSPGVGHAETYPNKPYPDWGDITSNMFILTQVLMVESFCGFQANAMPAPVFDYSVSDTLYEIVDNI